ncbi:hypothetical protein BOSE21B_111070 [Bosea sp. 21B]|nr:hypothetical protein BOSE21B_111070 [Bosea sp. 21B]
MFPRLFDVRRGGELDIPGPGD